VVVVVYRLLLLYTVYGVRRRPKYARRAVDLFVSPQICSANVKLLAVELKFPGAT